MAASGDGRASNGADDHQSLPVVGVDPGGRTTGIVAILSGGVVRTATVTNPGELLPLEVGYLVDVVETVRDMVGGDGSAANLFVEDVKRPSWHVARDAKRGAATDPTGLLATAQVLGAIRAAFPTAVLVPPRRNGSKPLGAYPEALVSAGERRKPGWQTRVGTGKMRHLRSAWDIATYYQNPLHTLDPHAPLTHEPQGATVEQRRKSAGNSESESGEA